MVFKVLTFLKQQFKIGSIVMFWEHFKLNKINKFLINKAFII
jgi:hypothetical protein